MKRVSDADKPRFVLYATHRLPADYHPRQYVPVFTDSSYAKRWLMRMLFNTDWERTGDSILCSNGMKIKSEQMDAILDCPDSDEPLLPRDFSAVMQFKGGSWEQRLEKPDPKPEPDTTIDGETPVPPVASKPAPKAKRNAKASVPPGYVTISALATTWNVKASDCRASLRASDMVKPDYGWAFAEKDIPKIKKLCGVK